MTKGVYIGPFQNIVNVGWGTAKTEIAVLQWHSDFITSLGRHWAATLSFPQLGITSNIVNLAATQVAPPGIPTPTLLGKNYWEYPPASIDSSFESGGGTITVVDRGIYYLATDFGIVTSWTSGPSQEIFTFADGSTRSFADATGVGPITKVPFLWDHTGDSSGGALLDADVNALCLNANGWLHAPGLPSPYLHSIVRSHEETVSSVTHNEEVRSAFIFVNVSLIKSLLGPSATSLTITVETDATLSITREQLTWDIILTTWKKRLTFPVSASPDYTPAYGFPFDFDPPFPDGSLEFSASGIESLVPAATITFDIDLTTFNVTGTRIDH